MFNRPRSVRLDRTHEVGEWRGLHSALQASIDPNGMGNYKPVRDNPSTSLRTKGPACHRTLGAGWIEPLINFHFF